MSGGVAGAWQLLSRKITVQCLSLDPNRNGCEKTTYSDDARKQPQHWPLSKDSVGAHHPCVAVEEEDEEEEGRARRRMSFAGGKGEGEEGGHKPKSWRSKLRAKRIKHKLKVYKGGVKWGAEEEGGEKEKEAEPKSEAIVPGLWYIHEAAVVAGSMTGFFRGVSLVSNATRPQYASYSEQISRTEILR